jgi:hypothetical protein
MVELASVNHRAKQDVCVKQMRMDLSKHTFFLYALETLIRKRSLGVLEVCRGIGVQGIQLGIASLVALVQAESLLGVEPAEEAVGVCGLIRACLVIR